MTGANKTVWIAGGIFDRSLGHACAFFRGEEEKYRVLLPFIKEGFEQGDKAIHITDPQWQTGYLRRLAGAGIEMAAIQASSQLELLSWEDAYLREGRFDKYAMLALVDEVLSNSRAQGFSLTRLTADMEWALEDLPGVSDLVAYEARANYILPKHYDAVI